MKALTTQLQGESTFLHFELGEKLLRAPNAIIPFQLREHNLYRAILLSSVISDSQLPCECSLPPPTLPRRPAGPQIPLKVVTLAPGALIK